MIVPSEPCNHGSCSIGNSSCGACKFLRRKCERDCICAPYFSPEEGAKDFAAIHKVFGASNMSKFLRRAPERDRRNVVETITYEAQARLRDPVYGCLGQIYALQQEVATLQVQLMQVKTQEAHSHSMFQHWQSPVSQWQGEISYPSLQAYSNCQLVPLQSSLNCNNHIIHEAPTMREKSSTQSPKMSPAITEFSDLDELVEYFFAHRGVDLLLDF